MSSVVGAIVDPSDPIVKILKLVDSDKLGLVAAADQAMAALEAKGYVYNMSIDPRSVGFDPTNRGGEGGHAQSILELAHEIAEVGWSWAECSHACCVEVRPGDSSVEAFNKLLAADCGLPPVPEGSIRYGSLACGHTNYALRCILGELESDDALLSENGRFSVHKISRRDVEFGSALHSGLKWRVIRHSVRDLYPEVLTVIQAARNMASQLHRKESELQGLLRLHTLSSTAMRAGRPVDWAAIKRSICRSRPPYSESLNELINFVITKSGGTDGHHLKFINAFYRGFVPAKRSSAPGPLYGALANFPKHFVGLAILEATFLCTADQVKAGCCHWATPAQVTALHQSADAALQARLAEAEDVLVKARSLLPVAGVSGPVHEQNKLVGCLGKLDVSMARFLLNRQETSKTRFTTIKEIANFYVKQLQEAFPDANMEPFIAEWQLSDEKPAETAIVATTEPRLDLYTLDHLGRNIDSLAELRARGFDIAATVVDTSVDSEASGRATLLKIVAVDGVLDKAVVKLQPLADGSASTSAGPATTSVSLAQFFAKYAIRDPRSHVELHPGWPKHRCSSTAPARNLFIKAQVLAGLNNLITLTGSAVKPEDISVFAKPVKKVVSNRDFGVGELVLVPETTAVKTASPDEALDDGVNLQVKVDGLPSDTSVFLLPAVAQESLAPLWFIASCEDQTKANMVWADACVETLAGVDFFGDVMPSVPCGPVLRRLRKKTEVDDDGVVFAKIRIPILTNKSPVASGDELFLHRVKSVSKKVKSEAITISQLAKRAKH